MTSRLFWDNHNRDRALVRSSGLEDHADVLFKIVGLSVDYMSDEALPRR
jgi:hypothetical protein